jgi:hypothetical protein
MTKKTPTDIAREIFDTAARLGWTLEVRGSILTTKKRFTPGDNDGFIEADMMYYEILDLLPRTRAGSDWGTDGGGIGALSAIKSGVFTMNRSGGSKPVLKALAKIL